MTYGLVSPTPYEHKNKPGLQAVLETPPRQPAPVLTRAGTRPPAIGSPLSRSPLMPTVYSVIRNVMSFLLGFCFGWFVLAPLFIKALRRVTKENAHGPEDRRTRP